MFVCVGEKRIKTREYVLIIVIYVPGYRVVITECLSRYMVSGWNRVSKRLIFQLFPCLATMIMNCYFNNRDTYLYFYEYLIMIILM